MGKFKVGDVVKIIDEGRWKDLVGIIRGMSSDGQQYIVDFDYSWKPSLALGLFTYPEHLQLANSDKAREARIADKKSKERLEQYISELKGEEISK